MGPSGGNSKRSLQSKARDSSMNLLRHILRFCVVILISFFGVNTVFSVPMTASAISFSQTEKTLSTQAANVGFAARAPPSAVPNVAITGGVTVMQGGAFSLHGQKTGAALFGFNGDFDAPNRTVDGIWDQGRFTPIQRGNAIEDHLAGTDYSGWTRVGSQNNGFSPAWDFNQGSTWC